MAYRRTAYPYLQLANNAYVGATVTFFKVDASTNVKTLEKATVYASVTGAEQVQNPTTLGSQGKLDTPVYFDTPVVALIGTTGIGEHETGIFFPQSGQYRGGWVSGQSYLSGDIVRDNENDNVYVAIENHVASNNFVSDISAQKWELIFDVSAVAANATSASLAAQSAEDSEDAAAASALAAQSAEINAETAETNAAASALAAQQAAAAAESAVASTEFPAYVTAGTASAYTITDGDLFVGTNAVIRVSFHVANNASPTLNVSAGGAVEIVNTNGRSLKAGEIEINRSYILLYDGALNKWVVTGLPLAGWNREILIRDGLEAFSDRYVTTLQHPLRLYQLSLEVDADTCDFDIKADGTSITFSAATTATTTRTIFNVNEGGNAFIDLAAGTEISIDTSNITGSANRLIAGLFTAEDM